MHRSGVDHFPSAHLFSQISHRLDRAYTHSAVEASLKSLATGCKKVAGPAVQADAIDKIGGPLSWFQIMLTAGIVGIADAAIAIAVVDSVLAPDLSLAYMNALFSG